MKSHFRGAAHGQEGQALVMLVVCITGLLAVAALAIDFGFAYHAYSELQASTQAAATAGALELPNTDAVTVANTYSGIAGGGECLRRPAWCDHGLRLPAGDMPSLHGRPRTHV